MSKVYCYKSNGKDSIVGFLSGLTPKLQDKLYRQLSVMIRFPNSYGEPHVKHFRIERYRELFEVREKYQGMLIRIIFAYDGHRNIILLEPFFKTHSRRTEQALESALRKLQDAKEHPSRSLELLSIKLGGNSLYDKKEPPNGR